MKSITTGKGAGNWKWQYSGADGIDNRCQTLYTESVINLVTYKPVTERRAIMTQKSMERKSVTTHNRDGIVLGAGSK